MSRGRIGFFTALCLLSGLWVVSALTVQYTRLEHRHTLTTIRAGTTPLAKPALRAAIDDYRTALRIAPCSTKLLRELNLLLGQHADNAIAAGQDEEAANALDAMQAGLGKLLACTPNDGKAWLDLAVINSYREGFTPYSLRALKMSAAVAPGESWLAQQRLYFSLKFRPLLDAEAIQIANRDLKVLERALPRMSAILRATGLKKSEELYQLFPLPTP